MRQLTFAPKAWPKRGQTLDANRAIIPIQGAPGNMVFATLQEEVAGRVSRLRATPFKQIVKNGRSLYGWAGILDDNASCNYLIQQ